MDIIAGGLEQVPGYSFSAIECGIRYPNRLDYCLIYAEQDCNASGMFTTNRVCAAPVKLCRARIDGVIRAILINATNANACTGEDGYRDAESLTADIGARLNLPPVSVLMASTGIIGRRLPIETMINAHSRLAASLSRDNGKLIPHAIMTTDTMPKALCISFNAAGREYHIAGTAKGAGMIAPQMATLLCFILTDAPVAKADLDRLFRSSIDTTLNAITIDGDMSTNDTAIILSPKSPSPLTDQRDLNAFAEALHAVLGRLAEMLIDDGEGTTKRVRVNVRRAACSDDAKRIARAVAESLLVKTAFFGNDPNWGRIAAAAGRAGVPLDEQSLCISFNDVPVLVNGRPLEANLEALTAIMAERSFQVTIDIALGDGEWSMLTTDISTDYVRINAEYST